MKKHQKSILVLGAGAIGRGFVAPIFNHAGFRVSFVENDSSIIRALSARNAYTTAVTSSSGYQFQKVVYANAYENIRDVDIPGYDIIVMCVGPRNCLNLSGFLGEAKTVWVLENDIDIVGELKEKSGNENIYFGIPDVITSNTAPPELLSIDPLCVVSEQGKLILERGDDSVQAGETLKHVEKKELYHHWCCKFYIHNAPHAIVAYLGALKNYHFIHEAMTDASICSDVRCAMTSVCQAVIKTNIVPAQLALDYMNSELKRFQNKLLFDPVTRVARDPMRKLSRDNRLVKSLEIVMQAGCDTSPFLKGINAAMRYRGKTVDDERFNQYRSRVSSHEILNDLCGINDSILIRKIIEAG